MAFLDLQIQKNIKADPLRGANPAQRIIAGQIVRAKARRKDAEHRTLFGEDRAKAKKKLRGKISGQQKSRTKSKPSKKKNK